MYGRAGLGTFAGHLKGGERERERHREELLGVKGFGV